MMSTIVILPHNFLITIVLKFTLWSINDGCVKLCS